MQSKLQYRFYYHSYDPNDPRHFEQLIISLQNIQHYIRVHIRHAFSTKEANLDKPLTINTLPNHQVPLENILSWGRRINRIFKLWMDAADSRGYRTS